MTDETTEEQNPDEVTTVLPPWIDVEKMLQSLLALALARIEPDPTKTVEIAWAEVEGYQPGRGLLITIEGLRGPVAKLIPFEEGAAQIAAIKAAAEAMKGPLN